MGHGEVHSERGRLAESTVRAGGLDLFALERPGPRPVVFVHGLAASSAYFADAGGREELAGRGVVAIDLPGFGRTPAPDGFGFTMREQAEVVAAAVDTVAARAGERPTLVGHSMGGTIAVLAAERLGRRVDALVVAEGVLYYDASLWSEQIARTPAGAWAEVFAGLCRRPEIFARGGMLRRRPEAVARVAPALLQTTAAAMHASATDLQETSTDPTLYDRFLALACRTVYVFGEYHDNTTAYARLTGDGAHVEVVPRAGHVMMLDNPEAFYRIVSRG